MRPASRALFALIFAVFFALFLWGGIGYITGGQAVAGALTIAFALVVLQLAAYNVRLYIAFRHSRYVRC